MITIRPFSQSPAPPATFPSFGAVGNWLRGLYDDLNRIRNGKLGCTFIVTLTNGGTTTIIKNVNLTAQGCLLLDPFTLNAANALRTAPGVYALEANRSKGQWTLTHANPGATDCSYVAVIIG